MPIVVDLDVELARRKMTLTELAGRVGITLPNMSVLKSGRAKAIRFSTLDAICRELGCQPGDLLRWVPAPATDPVPVEDATAEADAAAEVDAPR